jgi:hypothetical protein
MITVQIHLKHTSQPIVHEASNAYEKGSCYCVHVDTQVFKYPLDNIWRIQEDYNPNTNFPDILHVNCPVKF